MSPHPEVIELGTAMSIAVSYLFEALLALAFGWAGWQFRQARLAMGRLEHTVAVATTKLELFAQWKDMHEERDRERHNELGGAIERVWDEVKVMQRQHRQNGA